MSAAELAGYGLAVLVGILLGCLGGGGAILTVPILVYAFEVPVRQAVPMSLMVVGLVSVVGMLRHARAGQLRAAAALNFGPFAIVGAYLGSFVALRVSGRLQLTVFAVTLLAAALPMLRPGPTTAAPRRHTPVPALALLGAAVGFLTGFIGVGGGFLYVPALVLLLGLDMKAAVATSLALISLTCAAGLVGYLGKVALDWPLLLSFTGLALVGVTVGTSLVPFVPQRALRRCFGVLLLLMGTYVLIRGERRPEERSTAAPPESKQGAPVIG